MLGASVKDDPGAAANSTSRSTRASKSTAQAADLRPGYWKRGGQLGEGGRRAGGCRKQDPRGAGEGRGEGVEPSTSNDRVGGSIGPEPNESWQLSELGG